MLEFICCLSRGSADFSALTGTITNIVSARFVIHINFDLSPQIQNKCKEVFETINRMSSARARSFFKSIFFFLFECILRGKSKNKKLKWSPESMKPKQMKKNAHSSFVFAFYMCQIFFLVRIPQRPKIKSFRFDTHYFFLLDLLFKCVLLSVHNIFSTRSFFILVFVLLCQHWKCIDRGV